MSAISTNLNAAPNIRNYLSIESTIMFDAQESGQLKGKSGKYHNTENESKKGVGGCHHVHEGITNLVLYNIRKQEDD